MSKSVAIVTGASQGIGRATAVRLARDFPALVLVARNRAHLEDTTKMVRAAGAEVRVIDADAARAVVAQTLAVMPFGIEIAVVVRADLEVANAGSAQT